ncbi:hypothetical protein HID58_019023 [Brassica napus]|uniref:ABC transporter domain-containing protein n=1 Tax=Brassica napus TaxID=3708 RepID=A0ABQ8DCT2_BRANA|nr:hypothetical protein HID58_019023 [Brassica napus]
MELEGSSSCPRPLPSKAEMSRGAYLAWEDLTVVIPNFSDGPTRRLLQRLNGYAEPGRIMAIMGPSGSGKSTLLDSLAGRLARNVIMTGNLLLNGKKARLDYGLVAYVTQEDILLGTLTVRETITYSARLRLPSDMSNEEVSDIVEGTIMELGLQDCADRAIGNWHARGVSGGERKRVSIALEILTRPQILFLDEPTSGLDSASAFFVIQTLRNIARDGRTVISSIHQPSSEVFALFDDLFLLSSGESVYFGEAKSAVEFFAESGFPCPKKRNPSDHFLRCINSDFDTVTATLKGSQRIQETPATSDPLMNLATPVIRARLVENYRVQSMRSPQNQESKNYLTSMGVRWNVGTIFYDVGYSYTSILARVSCGGFITGFMTFMSIGGFPSFLEEMKVFYKERMSGYYGVSVYILSNYISSFPFLVSLSVITGTITYNLVKFRPGFSHYAFFCLNIFFSVSVIESLMMVVASLVPNFLMGLVTGAGLIGIIMMTSGFFRLLPDLPKIFWRYPVSYISYGSWAIQGGYKNDFLGLEFEPLFPGEPKMTGEEVINKIFRVKVTHSKWWDLAAVVGILVCYRLLFFVVLKLKERAGPALKAIQAKRTMRNLDRRPSFKRMPSLSLSLSSMSSRRHQPFRSLSSQEGLNSPAHY